MIFPLNSLLNFLRAEIQVTVADPLHLKPIPVVAVTTALELHLKAINGLLLEAATRGIGVLVEADAVLQADFQRGLQAALHGVTQDDGNQHEGGEEYRASKIGLQKGLPSWETPSI